MPLFDHEGVEIAIGYKGFLPFEVTGFTNTGSIVVITGYSGTTTGITVSTDAHQGGTNTWPALP